MTINISPDINLIIGGNNSGKSTMFDALRLWQLAFSKFLKDRTNNKQSSFRVQQYFSFTIDEISFLRVSKFEKLFHSQTKKQFEIKLTFSNSQEQLVELPITFTKTTDGQILRFELCQNKTKRIQASSSLSNILGVSQGTDFKSATLFTYINPIFSIPLYEPHYAKGYIINRLHQAKVNEVIRNLIHEHAPLKKERISTPNRKMKGEKLIEIENDLGQIFSDKEIDKPIIEFSTQLEEEDTYISLFGKILTSGIEVELSQLGSGTLNVLNILSVLAFGDYEKFKLNVLLLDEPDSHLHADLQRKLFDYLQDKSTDANKQIFIITHNHELIDCFEQVLFLGEEKKNQSISPIEKEEYYKIYKHISHDYHKKMLEIDEKKKIEEELSNIKRPTIYCEGTSDIAILKEAFRKLYDTEFFRNEVAIECPGDGCGGVTKILQNNKLEKQIIGILDNDNEGQKKKQNLENNHSFIEKLEGCYQHRQSYLVMLPIPQFRSDSALYFENNTHIEYLFEDEVLEKKLSATLIQYRGESFKRFDEKNKDKSKGNIKKNINSLNKDDFKHFIPLFETLANILDFNLEKEE